MSIDFDALTATPIAEVAPKTRVATPNPLMRYLTQSLQDSTALQLGPLSHDKVANQDSPLDTVYNGLRNARTTMLKDGKANGTNYDITVRKVKNTADSSTAFIHVEVKVVSAAVPDAEASDSEQAEGPQSARSARTRRSS
jgi:hypothetical protein